MTDPGVDLSVSLFVQAPAKWLFNVQFKKLEEEAELRKISERPLLQLQLETWSSVGMSFSPTHSYPDRVVQIALTLCTRVNASLSERKQFQILTVTFRLTDQWVLQRVSLSLSLSASVDE